MRTKYVAGNWKMNMDKAGAVALASELVEQLKGVDNKFMIAPPFVYLDAVAQVVKGSNIILGAQNIAATENGAHTGECSAAMLKDIGVETVILGHSERRYEFYETDKLINIKVRMALEHGLDVVLCIGELYSHKVAGVTEAVCEMQVKGGLDGLTKEQLAHVTIAYEPIWAIGTGKTPTPEEANSIHKSIRASISNLFGADVAENIKILYGGSMNAKNGKDLLAQSDIDGGLIGGASLKSETFVPICKYTV
ncbi:triose-phosphate isomerase [Treponema zioleckii]|uniref:triose-phosphate isomerase n=1 Tax=Treponema zioleckii TaxID=331680 RepID=UPI00168BD75A|nr:triose-phosphate isomerase [Treponema zioleckii]